MDDTACDVIDPVCGTELVSDDTDYQARYLGTAYYFCSLNCQLDFQEEPEKYLQSHV